MEFICTTGLTPAIRVELESTRRLDDAIDRGIILEGETDAIYPEDRTKVRLNARRIIFYREAGPSTQAGDVDQAGDLRPEGGREEGAGRLSHELRKV